MLTAKGYMKIDENYKYLIKMPMDSVSEENVVSLTNEMKKKQGEYDELLSTREQDIWLQELQKLRKVYDEQYVNSKQSVVAGSTSKKKMPAKKIMVKK